MTEQEERLTAEMCEPLINRLNPAEGNTARESRLRRALEDCHHKCDLLEIAAKARIADIATAKAVARKYGFTWNDTESVEGFVRDIITVLIAEREIYDTAIEKLRQIDTT